MNLRRPEEIPPSPSDAPTAFGMAPPAIPEAGHETSWALVAYFGPTQGQIYPLQDGDLELGRAEEATLQLDDDQVSRRHARLTITGDEVRLEDLLSTNGTWLNGQRLAGACPLRDGDRIRIGGHVLKLVAMDQLEWTFHRAMLEGATRDPLTGLPNRRASLDSLERCFAQARRHGVPASIAVVDLDFFKRINDTEGHAVGDRVLQAFAQRAGDQLRGEDTLGRIGGEEFLVVLPYSDKTAARRLLERIRWAVASREVEIPTGNLSLTCSLGLAQLEPGDRDALSWMARADGALYRAKHAGRNRVCEG